MSRRKKKPTISKTNAVELVIYRPRWCRGGLSRERLDLYGTPTLYNERGNSTILGWFLRQHTSIPLDVLEEMHWPWEAPAEMLPFDHTKLKRIVRINDSHRMEDGDRERELKRLFLQGNPPIKLVFKGNG